MGPAQERRATQPRSISSSPRCAAGPQVIRSALPDPPVDDSIGTRLRAARHAVRMSQAQLAASIACSQSLVALWEADRREPSITHLVAVAATLRVHPACLIEDAAVRTARSRWRPHARDELDVHLFVTVRAIRVEAGLSMYEAGRRAGIAPRRLSEIEHGRHPSLQELATLARAYEVNLAAFLGQVLTDPQG